ncbi:class I SAM-dependent methyltransferase [Actinomycetospora chlora]|uniref:Class I SAM-dependent methyltransferase n=1 Tax=Actinomycetospora chlora TaxID=663608 RepID=A0ABP9A8U0_9PSEU
MDADVTWVGSMPEVYERCLVEPVFRPFARELARRAATSVPTRILELAAGTGVVTAELVAALPDTEITATDLNEAMVALASARVPGPIWRVADAADLPFPDGAFDLVACGFGVMFLPDKPAGFAEVARVLAPDGRFVFSAWGTLPTHGFGQAVVDALEDVVPGEVPPFLATVPHGYADPARVADDLRAGGFTDVEVDTLTLEGTADDAADIAVGICTGTPMRADLARRGDLDATVARVAAAMTDRFGAGPWTTAMTAHLVAARRP